MWIILFLFIIHYGNSMELKSIHSCQTPLISKSKIQTSSTNMISNQWCPSSNDNEPYILLSLSNITYITRMNIKSLNIYYHLEYTRENLIDQLTSWHSYRLLNNKEENLQLDPPIIAKYIRLNIKQLKINSCLQLEFFGCIFTDGVVSYNMLQGTNQLEDDTYDGQYNEKHRYLYDGLGQLSDGQTGPDNYEDPQGFQWVGWRKSRFTKHNHSIGILFKFDTLRNFSRLTIHANNYYPKKIYVFRSITIEFLNTYDNNNNKSSIITYNNQHDDQFEMARPIIINLKYHIASQLKIHLYFDQNWILVSEFTFDSFIINQIHTNISLESNSFLIYILICLLIIMFILILPIFTLLLIRYIFKKKNFTSINSSLSTTSSDLDTNSSHHRYATIDPIQSSSYTKLLPTTNLLRSSLNIQQYHIEGICGNSVYSTQRSLTFDLNENLFISKEKINLNKRMENRYQIIGGGEIYQGDLQINQSLIPITIRRLLSNASVQSKISFFNEMSLLTSLCHPNIIHAYGFCSEPCLALLTESFDITTMDLYQYFQYYKQEQIIDKNFSKTILYFSIQISSALTYLESLHIYHRDIAARNCLITQNLHIKLQDLAMCNEIYTDDYVLITIDNDIQTRRPIRWCAWETICLNRFTTKSDVFSFGVLLWEILTMCERPHSLLNDDEVLLNLRNSKHNLSIPTYDEDLTNLILSCWNKYDYNRPSFTEINHFLCEKQQLLTIKSDEIYQQIII